MANGEPPDYFNSNNGIHNVTYGSVAPTVTGVVTTTSTNGPWIWDPNSTTWIVPQTYGPIPGQYTLPGLNFPPAPDQLVTDYTDKLVKLSSVDKIKIKGPSGLRPVAEVLAAARYVKYVVMGEEIVLGRPIWEALQTYLQSENGYAEMEPNEFLDKMFAPVDK